MSSAVIQLIVLAGIALFLILRLKNVLGTRDGFEGRPVEKPREMPVQANRKSFEVIEGGVDRDIADHVDVQSQLGQTLVEIKATEPTFSLSEFLNGARSAYEMILLAFEHGDRDTLQQFLAPEVYESFVGAIDARETEGLKVDAKFVGLRELKLVAAEFDNASKLAEITISFVGELTSVVRDRAGGIVEGNPEEIKRQRDVWSFARTMGSADPNWQLVATGG